MKKKSNSPQDEGLPHPHDRAIPALLPESRETQ